MSYATYTEVSEEFKSLDFAASGSKITSTKVDRFIAEADSEIDGYISSKYTVPISASVEGFAVLRRICIALVSDRIKKILNLQTDNKDISQFQNQKNEADKARMDLDKIRKGEIVLVGATLATTADGVKSFNTSTSYERKYKIDEDQW